MPVYAADPCTLFRRNDLIFPAQAVVAVAQSLLAAYMVEFTQKQSQFWMQTEEGVKYAVAGTPEFQV
jgi:hypothetical protein